MIINETLKLFHYEYVVTIKLENAAMEQVVKSLLIIRLVAFIIPENVSSIASLVVMAVMDCVVCCIRFCVETQSYMEVVHRLDAL
jgi:small basic protein